MSEVRARAKSGGAGEHAALRVEMFRRMVTARRFDEAAERCLAAGEIVGAVHSSFNNEALVIGATLALRRDDYMTGTHRSHAHPIGKGAAVDRLMAELFGKRDGVCKGKGGSMHLTDVEVGSLGESGIVGGGMGIAAGAGLSAKVRGTDQVCLAFFGDGGANAGILHESMNLAAIWKLPVIYFCENNFYAASVRSSETTAGTVVGRAAAYDMPGVQVDGRDPMVVYDATREAVRRARSGGGPTLIEAQTYRTQEHSAGHPLKGEYRTQAEIDAMSRDPLAMAREALLGDGVLTAEELGDLEAAVESEIARAVDYARESPFPEPEEAFEDVYSTWIAGPSRSRA